MALPTLAHKHPFFQLNPDRFELFILTIGRHLLQLSREDRKTPEEKLLHKAVILAYQLSYCINETQIVASGLIRAVSRRKFQEPEEHPEEELNDFIKAHDWVAADGYKRVHPWLAGRLIITHRTIRAVQSRLFL